MKFIAIAIPALILAASTFAAAAADPAAGKARATTVCAACHGANGISVANHIPNLAGQRSGYLVSQLRAFKDASRKHDVMTPIATQLAADDMTNIAAYFAVQPGAVTDVKSAFLPNLMKSNVTIPANFPTGFTRYKTESSAEEKSMTFTYANEDAIQAARAGKPLPDGSLIVVENHAVKLDADKKPIIGSDGAFVSDKVVSYAAMARNANWGDDIPELLRNENWNYGLFNAAKKIRADVSYAECFACHKPIAKSSYVFTLSNMVGIKK